MRKLLSPKEYHPKQRKPSTLQETREAIINALPQEIIEKAGGSLNLSNLTIPQLLQLYKEAYGHFPPTFEQPKEKSSVKSADTLKEAEKESLSIKEMRDFLLKELPFSPELLEKISLKELFRVYLQIFKAESNRESLSKLEEELLQKAELPSLSQSHNREKNKEKEENINYLKFLLMKLPKSLKDENNLSFDFSAVHKMSQEEIEKFISQAEELNKKREKNGYKMLVGIHISNKEYQKSIPPSKIESITILPSGEKIIVPPGYTHYSIEPTVYKEVFKRGGEVWFYLVEGAESHLNNLSGKYYESHKSRGWVAAAGELPIIASFRLDPELLEALGLEKV